MRHLNPWPIVAILLASCAARSGQVPAAEPAPPPRTEAPAAAAAAAPAQFASRASWEHAGYNNDEIVYTIFIKSQDSRILRCRTHMQGYYFNAGRKESIADQQLSTVFPQQQVQAGIWMDMDEKSGATYVVKCKAV